MFPGSHIANYLYILAEHGLIIFSISRMLNEYIHFT